MTRRATAFAEALLAVALVTWMAASQLPLLGLASAALLFLLPVLLAAVLVDSGLICLEKLQEDLQLVQNLHLLLV